MNTSTTTSFFLSFSVIALFLLNTSLSQPPPFLFLNITTDQQSLLAFKNSVSDPNRVLTNNWTTSNSHSSICNNWIGVSCGTRHQRVTSLNVSGFGLIGNIPPHLGNLTFLQSIDMSSNNFSGQIPPELSTLRRLKQLNLATNQITGSAASINISSLTEINMRYNQLSGGFPNHMCSNSPQLKRIYLTGNRLGGEISVDISDCRELEDLRLSENNLNGNIPSQIWSLPNLTILSLSSNRLQGFSGQPGYLPLIDLLYLGSNNFTGEIPRELGNLTSLTELYLKRNTFTGSIPKEFGNLTSIIELDLSYNQLSGELPEELGNLENMKIFAVAYNDYLSGPIPSSIFNISTLTQLAFQQNLFNGSFPGLSRPLPNLVYLSLSYNRFTGEIPHSINNAPYLDTLELNRNSFTGPIPNFASLTNLRVLRLWENKLTGLAFITSLTNSQYLEELELTDNPLNGTLPAASIGNLTSLVRFLASGCMINGTIPSEFGNLRNLQVLRITNNTLTGLIPAEIGGLNQLQELGLGGNWLQGFFPRDLCRLSNLGELELYGNMLLGPIPDCVGELQSLTLAYLYSNNFNSTIPSRLWSLTNLRILDLSYNLFSGQLSSQIRSLSSVNVLDLSYNQLSGDIPRTIEGCRMLQNLSLSNNDFSGSIPESLNRIGSLTLLDLSNNSLSGVIPRSLVNARGLVVFNVSYNELEGEIPHGGPFGNFTAQSFSHNSRLCGETRFGVPPCPVIRGSKRNSRALVVVKYGLPCFVSVIILVAVILVLIRRRRRRMMKNKAAKPAELSLQTTDWRRFSYIELERGTSSFSDENLLGRGSFGSVFKATLSDGLEFAVKVFHLGLEGATKSFDTESEILSSIKHRNLVKVLGCCTNMEFKALVLQYMQNGSLEKWLHSDSYSLGMAETLNVAIDVALALEYLHHGHTFPVVHCDIKPSNVLLDKDMTAHVGDFGISKLFDEGETMIQTQTVATIGYAAPEYGSEGKVSTKGDVYSYGIMLLEMFTRKRPTDDMFSAEMSLTEWVSAASLSDVVATGLLPREDDRHFRAGEECVASVFELAVRCTAFSPDERANMKQVVASLHKVKDKFTAATKVNNVVRRR